MNIDRTTLPTTRVPEDGPYHEKYPDGVRVSEFISSRAIEPFYETLQELVIAGTKMIYVTEMEQDDGRPIGPKGWIGASGLNDIVSGASGTTGATGAIDPMHATRKVYSGPPPVQDRTRYGLEELGVTIYWETGVVPLTTEKTLKVTPLLATLRKQYDDVTGKLEHESYPVIRESISTTTVLAKPLFFEVLKAYQTEPDCANWTAGDLYVHFRQRQRELSAGSDDEDCYMSENARERMLDNSMDPMLFDVFTITDSTDEKVAEKIVGRHVLGQHHHTITVNTAQCVHHYHVTLQALDLNSNMDTLLEWIRATKSNK